MERTHELDPRDPVSKFVGGTFIAIGLAVSSGSGFVLYRSRDAVDSGMLLAAFGAALGLWLALVGTQMVRTEARKAERYRLFPRQAWRWSREWESGEVRPSELRHLASLTAAAWFFVGGCLLVAIVSGMLWFSSQEIAQLDRRPVQDWEVLAAAALTFASGIGAAWLTARWSQLRRYRFTLIPAPGNVGGTVTGEIVASNPALFRRRTRAALTCDRTGQGRGATRLWEAESEFVWSKSLSDPDEVAASLLFHVPSTCQPTSEPRRGVPGAAWTLHITGPGLHPFHEIRFPIPLVSGQSALLDLTQP